ncbi:MAG TPA: carbonic anhydrase [Thermoanaerobaculia bacterium]|nr:carbonic anhydrase [Thermoanaerobaculia bacterium]
MRYLPQLFAGNREWVARRMAEDPGFFRHQSSAQAPDHLWIGCSDSRVPANEIVGLDAGELFVHRNVGNLARDDDDNAMAVLAYAVDVLRVPHVIVCGHSGCGGVQAALGPPQPAPLEGWIAPVRAAAARHRDELAALEPAARWRRLCEINVREQVAALAAGRIVRGAWERGQPLHLHGWLYELETGRLIDLEVSTAGPDEPPPAG